MRMLLVLLLDSKCIVVSTRKPCAACTDVVTHLSLGSKIRAHRLYTISALDDVRLEGDGARPAMQLEEKSACIAQDGAKLVATP